MHSDNSKQFVVANKELREMGKNMHKDEITKFGSEKCLQLPLNKASDAPLLNGACESLIRLVKCGLAISDSFLTFSEP